MRYHVKRRLRAGLSMIELMVALAILMVLILSFYSMTAISLTATRGAKPSLVAQEAAERTVERMQSLTVPNALSQYWDDGAGGVTHTTIGGVDYATSGNGLDEILHGMAGDSIPGLLQYYDASNSVTGTTQVTEARGQMGPPLDGGPPLRVRLLTEQEYQTFWGGLTNAQADLDFSGTLSTTDHFPGTATWAGWPAAPTYRMFPVLVEVHWAEGTTPRSYELKTILAAKEQMN